MEQTAAPAIRTLYSGRPVNTMPPRVAVLMVNSRGAAHPWFMAALDSVKAQSYDNIELLVLDNNAHQLSIGAAYNQLVLATDAEFVEFVSDDDLLTVDQVASSLACMLSARKKGEAIVHVTSNTLFLLEQQQQLLHTPFCHLGMFHREFLLSNRFNEALAHGVAADMHSRLDRMSKLMGKPISVPITHHYGYIWRQHIGMAGGMRTMPSTNGKLSLVK